MCLKRKRNVNPNIIIAAGIFEKLLPIGEAEKLESQVFMQAYSEIRHLPIRYINGVFSIQSQYSHFNSLLI